MVEIDPLVVEVSKEHLPTLGGGAWDDPRLDLCFGDGTEYVAEADADAYDVIVVDGTDPVGPGEGLFSPAFFRNARRILRPGGVFATQSETPLLMGDVFFDIEAALRQAFPRVTPLFGPVPLYSAGIWSYTHGSETVDPLAIIPERAAAVEPACRAWSRSYHAAAFVRPPWARRP
jgi:spermidine synthase